VASVLLYCRFKRALKAVENRPVYFASAEVECVDVKVRGRWGGESCSWSGIYVMSAEPEVEILCDNAPVELRGSRVSYKVAKALLQDAQHGDTQSSKGQLNF